MAHVIDVCKGMAFALGIDDVRFAAEVIESWSRKCLLHDILLLIVVESGKVAF